GNPNDCDAQRDESKWRHFWWMANIANGPGQRNSCGENCASASRYGGDGKDVISATGAGRGYRQMLCTGGENRADFDDHSGGSVGNALYERRAAPRYTRRLYSGCCG